jgi:hypothetical protein
MSCLQALDSWGEYAGAKFVPRTRSSLAKSPRNLFFQRLEKDIGLDRLNGLSRSFRAQLALDGAPRVLLAIIVTAPHAISRASQVIDLIRPTFASESSTLRVTFLGWAYVDGPEPALVLGYHGTKQGQQTFGCTRIEDEAVT